MSLRADDGTLLQAKEAIVIDQNGETIAGRFNDRQQQSAGGVRVFQLNGWYAPLLILAAVAAVALGTVFVSALVVFLLALGVVRFIKKLLS